MRTFLTLALLGALGAAGCGGSSERPDAAVPGDTAAAANFSFFITSAGNPKGGDFRRTTADTEHASQGCAAASFPPTGGRGSLYCFAADRAAIAGEPSTPAAVAPGGATSQYIPTRTHLPSCLG